MTKPSTPSPLDSMERVASYRIEPGRGPSADRWEIRQGATADVYFARGADVLRALGRLQAPVIAEVFSQGQGILCGVEEVLGYLEGLPVDVWALGEGEAFSPKEPVLRIQGPYGAFGYLETAILGALASASGWATAARRVREAAQEAKVYSFGARHVHPAVAPVMERAALIGGMDGAASILGARLMGQEPVGTVPHAVLLIAGDTVTVARALAADRVPGPVTVLVDTFHDEAEEALRVARELGEALGAVRLDTPGERGGVTPDLVREVRARLDLEGFERVQIFCTGSLTPERIVELREAGASLFGVGHYISSAPPIDMTMDVKVVDGRPVAKRGRIPGLTPSKRLHLRMRSGRRLPPVEEEVEHGQPGREGVRGAALQPVREGGEGRGVGARP
jgi:nicotinate phosphoribosyltransferase